MELFHTPNISKLASQNKMRIFSRLFFLYVLAFRGTTIEQILFLYSSTACQIDFGNDGMDHLLLYVSTFLNFREIISNDTFSAK